MPFPSTSSSARLGDEQRARPDDGATSSSDGTVTSTRSRLRNDLIRPTSSSWATTTSGSRPCPTPRRAPWPAWSTASRTPRRRRARASRCRRGSRARRASAARRALRLTLTSKLRMPGAKATPPPVNCGARIVPWRARPVPFWRHGFARPPETSPRLLAPRVPARCAFSSARTASCTRCGLTSAPNTAASSVTLLRGRRRRARVPSTQPSVGASRISTMPLFGPGNGALDEQQVALDVDLVDGEPELGDALAAHAAGHLHALEDARRRRRRADRAGLADVVRAVADGAALEVVALDRALEALADRRCRRP